MTKETPVAKDDLQPIEAASAPDEDYRDPDIPAGGTLFPADPSAHAELLAWCLEEFNAADRHRAPLARRWKRYYKLYRSYVQRRTGDWRSKLFIPIVWYVVEAVAPRMVAQLPKFIVNPIEEEDEEPAKVMEQMLEWAAGRSNLYLELVKIYGSALKYGTGIGKVRYERCVKKVRRKVPEMADVMMTSPMPMMDPATGQPMTDINGQPMMGSQEMPRGQQPTGRMKWEKVERVLYDGPICDFVPILNFWPAPEATSIEDARYVIQRTFRDTKYVKRMFASGVWKMPPGVEVKDVFTSERDELTKVREEIGDINASPQNDLSEVLEFWTDDTLTVVLNRSAIVRCDDNPYEHGEKPFVRLVDYFQEGEFWGMGEIEPLEGFQDAINALWNQRIDNVRLVLNKMFAFDPENIIDQRDLQVRPGGTVRVRSRDIPVGQVLQELDFSDVTSSSYTEVAELERMTEKVSGVSGYTTGTDSPTMNQTATGVSIITEQGNTRFALKVRMAELTALVPLSRMYASILQQFMPDEQAVRIVNDDGAQEWVKITADSLQGAFDFDIEAQSSTVTESVRKEQSMSLIQTFSQIIDPATGQPVLSLQALADDVLDAFGKKNKVKYAPAPPPPPPTMQPALPGMEGEDPSAGIGDPNQILAMMQGGAA